MKMMLNTDQQQSSSILSSIILISLTTIVSISTSTIDLLSSTTSSSITLPSPIDDNIDIDDDQQQYNHQYHYLHHHHHHHHDHHHHQQQHQYHHQQYDVNDQQESKYSLLSSLSSSTTPSPDHHPNDHLDAFNYSIISMANITTTTTTTTTTASSTTAISSSSSLSSTIMTTNTISSLNVSTSSTLSYSSYSFTSSSSSSSSIVSNQFVNYDDESEKELFQQYLRNQALETPILITLIIMYTILIFIGAFGNGLVCLAVARNPRMRTPQNIFIVNLAISDLLLCFFTIPFSLFEIATKFWPYGVTMCKLVQSLEGTSIFVSTLSIITIALDRYNVILRSMNHPEKQLHYNQQQRSHHYHYHHNYHFNFNIFNKKLFKFSTTTTTSPSVSSSSTSTSAAAASATIKNSSAASAAPATTSATSTSSTTSKPAAIKTTIRCCSSSNSYMFCLILKLIFIWIVGIILSMPLFLVRTVESHYIGMGPIHTINFCIEKWPIENGRAYYSVLSMLIQYVGPIIIVSFVYAKLCIKLRHRTLRRTSTTQLLKVRTRLQRRTRKTNLLLISIALIFFISWLPLNVLNIVADFFFPVSAFRITFAICHMFGMSSACSNPFLYGWLNQTFRNEFKEIFNSFYRLFNHRLCCCCGGCGCGHRNHRDPYHRNHPNNRRSCCGWCLKKSTTTPATTTATINQNGNLHDRGRDNNGGHMMVPLTSQDHRKCLRPKHQPNHSLNDHKHGKDGDGHNDNDDYQRKHCLKTSTIDEESEFIESSIILPSKDPNIHTTNRLTVHFQTPSDDDDDDDVDDDGDDGDNKENNGTYAETTTTVLSHLNTTIIIEDNVVDGDKDIIVGDISDNSNVTCDQQHVINDNNDDDQSNNCR